LGRVTKSVTKCVTKGGKKTAAAARPISKCYVPFQGPSSRGHSARSFASLLNQAYRPPRQQDRPEEIRRCGHDVAAQLDQRLDALAEEEQSGGE